MEQGDGSLHWLMKRNCSFAPRQLLAVYLGVCLLALAIGVVFWMRGATLVLPFAGLELGAVGIALLLYTRHATDRESMVLRPGRFTILCTLGRRTEQVEFAPAWVRVEPVRADGSLIELSGEGRRIAVGRFIRPELRRALADELRAALRRSCGAPAVA
ncbi:MAG: DUF2244 domain-containing protein [Caldimonas sp.]